MTAPGLLALNTRRRCLEALKDGEWADAAPGATDALSVLEAAGFVTSRPVAGQGDLDGPVRLEYRITSRGLAALLRDDL